jgi:hypothetical protein
VLEQEIRSLAAANLAAISREQNQLANNQTAGRKAKAKRRNRP